MMPKIVVNMKPEGSFLPGMRNLAMTPAINPMMMVQRMLIVN
jgi:DNA-binding transcriptional regulator YhcF (GntR family)